MIALPGYEIKETLAESNSTVIYRAKRLADHASVVIKLLKEENIPALDRVINLQYQYVSLHGIKQLQSISRFKHEYEILHMLKQQGTVAVYGFEKCDHSLVMILEDGGIDLKHYLLAKQRLSLTEAVHLAISIAECLDKIHKHHIIHKNINPENILVDSTSNKVKIIDFDNSTTLSKESLPVFSLYQLPGVAAYLSPEQTGRMNRGIDYRSDYYSLGVLIYQFLTGKLPFTDEDPIKLVYAHIARIPVSPHEVDQAIPKPVSDIVMKLLAKTAEQRYQSLFGIITDLKRCLLQIQRTGTVAPFTLAEKDFSTCFQIPEKLYGRTNEINFLMDTFDRVSKGHSELMLIAGHSGIGKSSLVHEIHRPIVAKRGYFISGKFDQLQRNIPYAPFVQALDGLIKQILTESDADLKLWRTRLLSVLGPNGGVMTEVLPSLENLIGKQPPIPELGPTETQNRFILVFQNFIQVFATRDHPLVMFLDDLQWVDLPSLRLLRGVLSDPSIQYLFIIGAYRDNEVDSSHPLMLTLDSFKKSGITLETLKLAPLKISHIQQLLSETMSQDLSVVAPLAEVCYSKTLGNPFFLNQFLRAVSDEGLIAFDTQHEFWHWKLDAIKSRGSTDNVVDLLVSNIKKLSPAGRVILKDASCFGNRFNLQMLSVLYEKTPKETAHALNEVLQESFILPLDESYKLVADDQNANAFYRFLHDRVQQAAYSLLEEQEKQSLHLKIGRYLRDQTPEAKIDDKLFDIVNHLNFAADLMEDANEKQQLSLLNLRAGQKATASAAYSIALNYFQSGLKLLSKNAWQLHYELTLQLYTHAAEAAYLNDNFEISEHLGNEVVTNAHSVLDQVKVYQTKMFTEIARNAPATAVMIGLKMLRKLGVKLPEKPTQFHIILSLIKTKLLLLTQSNKKLVELPDMMDPYKLAACKVLSTMIAPAYYAAPTLYPLVTLELLNLSIRYGYNKGTPASFSSYGIILCGVLNEIDRGYEFGQLASQLVERHKAVGEEVKVSLMVNALISHWRDPYRQSLAPLLMCHVRGIEVGDLDYSAYATYFCIDCGFLSGIKLPQVAEDTKKFYQIYKTIHTHKPILLSIATVAQTIENLRGLSKDPCSLNGSYYQEKIALAEAISINHEFGLFLYYNAILRLNYLFYHYDEAYKAALVLPKYINSATGAAPVRDFNFYHSLTLVALCEHATPAQKRTYLRNITANQKKMQLWAKHSPVNNQHKYLLVEAELARIQGRYDRAASLYDQAILLANQNEYLQDLALAYELAGKYYLSQNNHRSAKHYFNHAYKCYSNWGAMAKIRHLESSFAHLLDLKVSNGALH